MLPQRYFCGLLVVDAEKKKILLCSTLSGFVGSPPNRLTVNTKSCADFKEKMMAASGRSDSERRLLLGIQGGRE